ncbi:MAG: ATP-binding protein, partial [Bradymonadaceae bacterium]
LSPPLLGRSIRYALAHRRTLSVVHQSEARFRTIIESSPDAVFLHRDQRVVYVNPAGLNYLGYERPEDVLGRLFLEFIHQDDQEIAIQAWAQAREGDKATPVREVRFQRATEECLTAEVVELSLRYEGTDTVMSTARDVTERKELRTRIILSERMASLGTLAAGVAHEINNPLSFVTANLELAQQEVDALSSQIVQTCPHLEEARQALAKAGEGADRVRLIVRDLKQFSRGDDETIRAVDIHEILEQTLTLAQNQVRHRARVVRRFNEVPRVKGNASRLGQVFLNLLVNAAQAIPEGMAPDNQIILETHVGADGFVIVRVSDSGVGIESHVLDRIFDPFFTTKAIGEGMGLGLPICHGIISSLGGDIHIQSTPGQGTQVTVCLQPAKAESATTVASHDEGEKIMEPGPPLRSRGYIAVIDDEPMIGDIVQRALRAEHEVEVFSSGKDVLIELEEGKRYDVILCDLMMPDVTGMEMHQILTREVPEQARRMVFMTGGAFTPQARDFLEEVDNLLVEKPFNLGGLRSLLRDLVQGAERAADHVPTK